MSAWLIAFVGAIYAFIAVDQLLRGNVYMAIVFSGYSFSNVGLYLMTK
jgi:hypothetical protein